MNAEQRDSAIFDALVDAFRAEGWRADQTFDGGIDVEFAAGLSAMTGITGWHYASVSELVGDSWEPAGDDPEHPTFCDEADVETIDPAELGRRAVEALQRFAVDYVAARTREAVAEAASR